MRLIVTGCEFVGKSTLGEGISRWIAETMGSSRSFHDHFTIPSPEVRGEDKDHFMAMSPAFKERFQRYQIDYHLHPSLVHDADHMLTGYHIEEAVFAPLYYGYGGDGQYAARSPFARSIERTIMELAPDFILVMLKASPDAIAERMKANPRPRDQAGRREATLQEKDIEHVLQRFDEELSKTLIRKKIVIDNTSTTPEETVAEFVSEVQKHLSQADRLRILTNQALKETGQAREAKVDHIKTRKEE